MCPARCLFSLFSSPHVQLSILMRNMHTLMGSLKPQIYHVSMTFVMIIFRIKDDEQQHL